MLHEHLVPRLRPLSNAENTLIRGEFRLTVLADRLFRIETAPGGAFADEASQLAWYRDAPPVKFRLTEAQGRLELDTGAVRLSIDLARPLEGAREGRARPLRRRLRPRLPGGAPGVLRHQRLSAGPAALGLGQLVEPLLALYPGRIPGAHGTL